jgi:hypothetical protein
MGYVALMEIIATQDLSATTMVSFVAILAM